MTGRVLVAGGTGRLGTLLVAALATRGTQVRVMTRDLQRASHLTGSNVEVVLGDVRDRAGTVAAATGVDVVVSAVHGFAGPGGVSPSSVDRDGNIALVQAARTAGADVVLMSVVGAAPDSAFELFRMKHAAEQALAASGVPGTVVRAAAFVELWVDILRGSAASPRRPVVLGRGQNPITFVSVRDVAALVARVVADPTRRGQCWELGGPDTLTMTDLAFLLTAGSVPPRRPRHVPRLALQLLAATAGRLRPGLGRQTQAAVEMDRVDMTFRGEDVRLRWPDLPCTTVRQLLGRPAAEGQLAGPGPA